MQSKFDKVFDLFLNTSILTLRKYETNGINIYEFDKYELEKIIENQIIEKLPSIYILENTNDKIIYIGETENFINRIKMHNKDDKKNFNKIYVINSSILNKNICLEIESKTIHLFKNSINNYQVVNSNLDNKSYLSKADKLRFENYWKAFQEIYFLLKFNLLPKDDNNNEYIKVNDFQEEKEINEHPLFYCGESIIKIVDEGFLLLKNSKISMSPLEMHPKRKSQNNDKKRILRKRKKLIKERIMNENGIFLQDYFWKYPSHLSNLILAKTTNAYYVFKTKDDKTLDEYLKRK